MMEEALLYPDSTRTLICFRDIRKNMFPVCTHEDNKEEFLLITKSYGYGHEVQQTHTTRCIQGDFLEC
jgi:hypothetical protein